MNSVQPFLFIDVNSSENDVKPICYEGCSKDPLAITDEDLNDIEENGFFIKNVQGVMKFEIIDGNDIEMVASRNDLEKDEKIYDNDEFQSEETNSAHSDIDEKSDVCKKIAYFEEEADGSASSTETMSSDEEDSRSIHFTTQQSAESNGYFCKWCEFLSKSYETMQQHYNNVHMKSDFNDVGVQSDTSIVQQSISGQCSRYYLDEDNSNPDYLYALSQQVKEKYNCPFCSYSCLLKGQMCRHICNDHGSEIISENDSLQESINGASSNEDSMPDKNDYLNDYDPEGDSSPVSSSLRRRRRIHFDSIAKEHSILARILEERHQDPNRFTCEICDFKSSFRYAIISHFEVRHGAKRIYSCDSCEYLTHSEYFLKRHSNSKHSEKKVYKCKSCEYSSARRYTMRSHIDSVHKKIKPFPCSQCNYSAARRDALKMHVTAIHEGKRPFSCNECNFSSSRKYLLKNHVRSYHGPCAQEALEKMFTCAVCGFMAKTSSSLKEHLSESHGGSTKSNKDSEDVSSYSCDLCNFKCHRRTNLYSHRKAMHAGPDASRKHPCPFCFYFAYKITGLKGHITKCHKDCSYTDIDRIISSR